MPTQELAGIKVDLDGDGYMTDPSQWTREVAAALAKTGGIEMTEEHWKVVDFVRRDAAANGGAPNVRRLSKAGGFPTKELYRLFPGGPGKWAAKVAGYPKPTGCI
jgi:dissimilatory sulfite reductase related protein